MPATPAVIALWSLVTTAATTYQAVQHNQDVQHAKGAAEAQDTSATLAMRDQEKALADQQKQSSDAAAAAATAATNVTDATATAAARKRAMASGTSGSESTILTSPLGAPPAMTFGKTLLGA